MITIVSSPSPAYAAANAQPMVAWRNLLAEGTITDSGLPAEAPRANAITQDTVAFWAPTGAATIRTTLSGAETASVAFVAAHTLGSAGRTLKAQYYNGSTWVDIASVSPTDDQPFAIVFPDTAAAGWGFDVSGSCRIGVAWIGPRLVLPGGVVPDYTPLAGARTIERLPGSRGRTGHFLGQRNLSVTASLTAQLMPLERTFIESAAFAAFMDRYIHGHPFVWAPAPSWFAEAAYCWNEEGRMGHSIRQGGEFCNVTLNMSAYCAE